MTEMLKEKALTDSSRGKNMAERLHDICCVGKQQVSVVTDQRYAPMYRCINIPHYVNVCVS